MSSEKNVIRRRDSKHLRLAVYPAEELQIKQQAAAAGLSIASYLRNCALGAEIKSVVDYQKVDTLAKVSGDLGRFGGLLKLWLTKEEKLARFADIDIEGLILNVLNSVLINQSKLKYIIQHILRT